MNRNAFSFRPRFLTLLLMMTMLGAAYLYAPSAAGSQVKQGKTSAGAAQQPAAEVRGTWSGTLFSKHSNVVPFTMTVVINPDSKGHLIGNSSLSSDCLKDARLEVTVTGSNVLLTGSDDSGDNITVRGTVDKTGTLLKASYILNGSPSGRCETDNGTVSLAKR